MTRAEQSERLTERSWDDLFDFLDPNRPDKAGEERDGEASAKYEEIHLKLKVFFAGRGRVDAEDLAMETILRVAGKCRDGAGSYEGDRTRYFYGFARNVFHEAVERPPEVLPMPEPESTETKEARQLCLDHCMEGLTDRAQQLVLNYYREDKGAKIDCRRQLAKEFGKSVNALRIEVYRIRKTLQRCVLGCMNTETGKVGDGLAPLR